MQTLGFPQKFRWLAFESENYIYFFTMYIETHALTTNY